MHLNPRNRSRGHPQQGNPLVPRFRVIVERSYNNTIHSAPQRSAYSHNTTSQPNRLNYRVPTPTLTEQVSRFTHTSYLIPHHSVPRVAAQVNPPWWSAARHPLLTHKDTKERKPTRNRLRSSGHPHPTIPQHAHRGMASPCP